jgi:putative endonuclease
MKCRNQRASPHDGFSASAVPTILTKWLGFSMNYSCVLLSGHDGRFYIGSTGDLLARLQKHSSGAVHSTAHRRPLRLISSEGCLSIDDARRRKRYLKTGQGGRYLKQRLASCLTDIRSNKLKRH